MWSAGTTGSIKEFLILPFQEIRNTSLVMLFSQMASILLLLDTHEQVLITSEKKLFCSPPLLEGRIHFSNSHFRLASYLLLSSLRSELYSVLSFRTLGGLAMTQPFLFHTDMFLCPQNHSTIFIPPILITKK